MGQFPPERPEFRRPSRKLTSDKPVQRPFVRHHVVLHRNADVDLMFVIRCIMELTRFPRAEATYKMWQAHHGGRSVILSIHLERAELFVEQFAERGLKVSVEPAGK